MYGQYLNGSMQRRVTARWLWGLKAVFLQLSWGPPRRWADGAELWRPLGALTKLQTAKSSDNHLFWKHLQLSLCLATSFSVYTVVTLVILHIWYLSQRKRVLRNRSLNLHCDENLGRNGGSATHQICRWQTRHLAYTQFAYKWNLSTVVILI